MDTIQTGVSATPELTVGSVLSRTFSTLMKNPVLFFGLAIVISVPTSLIEVMLPENGGMTAGLQIVDMILGLAIQGAIAYGVYQVMRGNVASIGSALSRGMARIVPLIAASILTGLGIGLGMLLFVVPGVILTCIWAVTIPACVVERLGPIQSIKRSAELTAGYRLTVFALVLITGIVIMAIAGFGVFLAFLILPPIAAGVVVGLISALPQAFNCVMIAIIYYDLRAIKEGVSIDSLANVFD